MIPASQVLMAAAQRRLSIDPYWDNVELLLSMDGEDDGVTFTDLSSYGRTITRGGDAKTVASTKKFGTASAYFDGTGDYLLTPQLLSGTEDFTLELHAYFASLADQVTLFSQKSSGAVEGRLIISAASPGRIICFQGLSSGSISFSCSDAVATGSFYHIAVTRQSGVFRIFVDGLLLATNDPGATYAVEDADFYVGRDPGNTSRDYVGYMDNVRITTGLARYTSDFNLPSRAFPVRG